MTRCFEIYTGPDIKDKDSGDEYEFQTVLTPQDSLASHIITTLKTVNSIPGEPIDGFDRLVLWYDSIGPCPWLANIGIGKDIVSILN